MRVMVGLTPATAGEVTIGGLHFHDIPNPGRHVGVLLDASAQHAGRTGREVLTIGAKTMGLPMSRVDEMLALVALDDTESERRLRNYSLGMRQRLGIAHALLGDPSVLILDEPANGLDPAGIRWMRGLLSGYADRGGTVLLSSHLLHEVEQIADEMLLIGRGKIVARGTKAELLAGAGGTGTLVVAEDNERLSAALTDKGLTFTPSDSGSRVDAEAGGHRSCSPLEQVGRALRPAPGRGSASRTCSSSSPPTPSATTSPTRPPPTRSLPHEHPDRNCTHTVTSARPRGCRSAGWSASSCARCSTPAQAGGC